jgi:hypothetical protein
LQLLFSGSGFGFGFDLFVDVDTRFSFDSGMVSLVSEQSAVGNEDRNLVASERFGIEKNNTL